MSASWPTCCTTRALQWANASRWSLHVRAHTEGRAGVTGPSLLRLAGAGTVFMYGMFARERRAEADAVRGE